MAQGIAWDKEKILKALEPYLKLGMSRRKACIAIGLDSSLLAHWEEKEPELSVKINAWVNEPNISARKLLVEKIQGGSKAIAQWWLERKERKEFSTRQEVEQNVNVVTEIKDTLKKVSEVIEDEKDKTNSSEPISER